MERKKKRKIRLGNKIIVDTDQMYLHLKPDQLSIFSK